MWYNDALGQNGPDMGGEMYARITPYKMKPGSREAATAKMNELKAEILGLPGMQHFMSAMNEDGSPAQSNCGPWNPDLAVGDSWQTDGWGDGTITITILEGRGHDAPTPPAPPSQ